MERSITNAIAHTKKSKIDKIHKSTDKSSIVPNAVDKENMDKLCSSVTGEDFGRKKTKASTNVKKNEDLGTHIRHPSNPENRDIIKYISDLNTII